jgi:NADH-quinone oxidoreductase subunit N
MAIDLIAVLGPFALVALGGLVCLASEPFLKAEAKHRYLPWIGFAFLAAAALAQVALLGTRADLDGVIVADPIRGWLVLATIGATLCGLAGLQYGLDRDRFPGGEPYALLHLAACGVILMVVSSGFVVTFVGMELASLAVYSAVGLDRSRRESGEALLKYLVMGAVFGGLFAYGMALTYGATGSVAYGAAAVEGRDILLILGHALMALGLLFKVGAVPFHFWSPDAYTGAPLAITGFMAAVMKIGGFTALGAIWLNLLVAVQGGLVTPLALGEPAPVSPEVSAAVGRLPLILISVGVLSLLLGNFSALGQTSLRRLLAYSGVAHAGYLLMALALPGAEGAMQLSLGGLWFYLISYAAASAGLMACAAVMVGPNDADELDRLGGAARRHPFVGVVFTLLAASLAGFPPTAGFLGKYLIFADLVAKGEIALTVVAMLMAVVGAYYYLRLIIAVWSGPSTSKQPAMGSLGTIAVSVAAILVILLLILPDLVLGAGYVRPVGVAAIGP